MERLLWQQTLGHFHTLRKTSCHLDYDPVILQVNHFSASARTQGPTEAHSALSPAAAAAQLRHWLGRPSPGQSPPSDHSIRQSSQQSSSFPGGLPPGRGDQSYHSQTCAKGEPFQ